jgi:hypothetical protein
MLTEHLRVQRAATLRKTTQTLDERDFYPAHDQRSDRPKYDQVHQRLCFTLDLPCLVCGVRNSTLSDPAENRYGARQMETHHHVIEWALADAVDTARFNKTIRPFLLAQKPGQVIYQRDMSAQEVRDWVDHSEDNLWVLCDIHHRHRALGIHDTPYPLWCPQDLLRADFVDYVPIAAVLSPVVTSTDKPTTNKPVKRSAANRITAKLKVTPRARGS